MFDTPPTSSPLKIWSLERPEWNYGDVLALILAEKLFYVFDVWDQDVRILGSVISDGLVPIERPQITPGAPSWRENHETKIIYWGCGIREPGDFCDTNRDECDFLSVRGPITASELRLGHQVAMGEPGLLLPALYEPKKSSKYEGLSVCIPHFNDERKDSYFLSESGCDVVLRPNLRRDPAAIYDFIDAICSASFVLSAALHGAITAAAYRIPFAFWNNGFLDLPTKWQDFAESVSIETEFASNLSEGWDVYRQKIVGALKLPSMWESVLNSPFLLREGGLMSVLLHELKDHSQEDVLELLRDRTCRTVKSSAHFKRLENRVRFFSKTRFTEMSTASTQLKAQIDDTFAKISDLQMHLNDVTSDAANKISSLQSELDEVGRELMDAKKDNVKRDVEHTQLQRKIEELTKDLDSSMSVIGGLQRDKRDYLAEAEKEKANLMDREIESRRLASEVIELNAEILSVQQRESTASDELRQRRLEGAKLIGLKNDAIAIKERELKKLKAFKMPAFAGMWSRRTTANLKFLDDIRIIDEFVTQIPHSATGVLPEGRRARIVGYLLGLTDYLPDFPLLKDLEYLEMYPDVTSSRMRPLVHFIRFGRAERRNPHPLMDGNFYLEKYPEAAFLAGSPAEHFLKWGAEKNYNPHPLFDTAGYLTRYSDLTVSKLNPLVHAITFERCIVHPLFDPNYYLERYTDVANDGRHPLAHFLLHGTRDRRDPHPMFRTAYYVSMNPDVEKSGDNTLVHYVRYGAAERRRTTELFDPNFYLATYPDIAQGNIDPLIHFVDHGQSEGRLGRRPVFSVPKPISDNSARPVAVMVDAFFPRPDQDSGSLDQISFIKIFQSLGYEVHFVSILEFGSSPLGDNARYIYALQDLGVVPIRADRYSYIEEYLFINSDRIEIVFGSRVDFGSVYLEAAKSICCGAKLIFNTVDLHFLREQREAHLRGDEALFEKSESTKMREIKAIRSADISIVVSEAELLIIKEIDPSLSCAVVPLIREFSTELLQGFDSRSGIAFIGGFLHAPNIDAVEYFLEFIWPGIYAIRPDITFYVVGANMPEAMKDRQDPGVSFIGYIEDLEAFLSKVKLTVAPLRWGAGAKGKLVSSLGNGVPCVATPVASEGMGLTEGREVSVASLDSFGAAVVRLYDDYDLWTQMSKNGLDRIRDMYSLEQGTKQLLLMLQSIDAQLPSRTGI